MKTRWAIPLTAIAAAALVVVATGAPRAATSGLPPLDATLEGGWRTYVAAVEARHVAELRGAATPFLVLDRVGRNDERRKVLAGTPVIESMASPPSVRAALDGGRIHHWRGAVFVKGTSVDRLIKALESAPPPQEDVLRARVMSRGPEGMRVYLRIRRKQVVTVVYDTEHLVRFQRMGPGRARSISHAVRIVELEHPGTPNEQALGPDDDRDFLWRLQAYWRYEDVEGGVLAECESVSLSRDVPTGLGFIAGPFIRRAAESSMRAALMALPS